MGQSTSRGHRGPNKKPRAKYVITDVGRTGEPLAPKSALATYKNTAGYLVRDHVPVSIAKWEQVPADTKNMLWGDMKATFTFPEDKEELVKKYTLQKMAISFQTWKKQLTKNYIDKNLTPNFEDFPKLQNHWDDFVAYKASAEGQTLSEKNKENASKKKYFHRLGPGGYKTKIPKWEKREAELIAKDVVPETYNWPERSKHWFYAHGGSLDDNGTALFGKEIREVATKLKAVIDQSSQGAFVPDRENDELTTALENPEHPGRTRGVGVVPWKEGFAKDVESYRSRSRAKAREANLFHALEQRVQQLEVALSSQHQSTGQQGGPQPITSPSARRSSCASGGLSEADLAHCPVDDITQRTPCELHVPLMGVSVKVAYGAAFPVNEAETVHSIPIPPGYAKVSVEDVCDGFQQANLEVPVGDEITQLGEAVHSFVMWRKRYIVFQNLPRSDPPQGSQRGTSPPPSHSPHVSRGSPSPPPAPSRRSSSPPSGTPTPTSTSKAPTPLPPKKAPPPKKAQAPSKAPTPAASRKSASASKASKPIEKLPYEKTAEELKQEVDASVTKFFKKPSPEKKEPVDPNAAKFFLKMASVKQTGSNARPQTNYERAIDKGAARMPPKKRPSPKKKASPYKKTTRKEPTAAQQAAQMANFLAETGLTTEQIFGEADVEAAPVVKPFRLGEPFLQDEPLHTKMRQFQEWYLRYYRTTGNDHFAVQIKQEDYYRGNETFWVHFEVIKELYNKQALDVAIMSFWVL